MTSSRRSALRGKQAPRVLLRPKFDSEADAQDACELIESCGQPLDEFQVLLTCMTLATLTGRLSASEVAALLARQNGKGGWLEAVAIWSLFEVWLYGERDGLTGRKNTTLWTAHELKTSDEAYGRVVGLIKSNPDLAAEVVTWNGGLTGTHIIALRDGSRLVFLARSKSSGRGFSPRRIIFDEAQEFSAPAFRAMMYATSAQGARRQLIYAGTVPSEENDSAIWTGVRDRGRSGATKRGRLAWAEWTPTGSEDPRTPPDPTDWKVRAEANPALGSRILADTIDEEWEAAQADLEGFMRERLSVWPSRGDELPTVMPNWALCGTHDAPPKPAAIAVAVDPDRVWLSIGAASGGDRPFLGAVRRVRLHQNRSEALAEVVRIQQEHSCAIALDRKGPASSLEDQLVALGATVTPASLDDYVAACADLFDAVAATKVRHGDHAELNEAVAMATQRKVGERWAWARNGGDVSMLEAVTLAMWAADETTSVYETREVGVF